jgi:cobalamin biosynthesis Mg chelatase CobN
MSQVTPESLLTKTSSFGKTVGIGLLAVSMVLAIVCFTLAMWVSWRKKKRSTSTQARVLSASQDTQGKTSTVTYTFDANGKTFTNTTQVVSQPGSTIQIEYNPAAPNNNSTSDNSKMISYSLYVAALLLVILGNIVYWISTTELGSTILGGKFAIGAVHTVT